MKIPLHSLSALMMMFTVIIISCQKSDNPPDEPDPSDTNRYILTYNDSKLVDNLNGYRFEAAYGTSEPFAYPHLWVQYVDDYLDSTRVLLLNQNANKDITQYQVSNHYNGNMTRYFNHASFPNDASGMMSINFNHSWFILNTYNPEDGTISETGTVFGINTQVSHIFTGMYEQFSYQFLNRFLIRYISGASIWPFNYPNWSDEAQFVATSELSAPKAIDHYYDESFSTFPYDVRSNMYSGFFQSTNAATYVGIAKGSANLDTVYLNNNPPDWYDPQICKAFIDKINDTLYLGVLINIPNTIELLSSLYRMDLTSNNLTELYGEMSFPYGNVIFRRGEFYGIPAAGGHYVKVNKQGVEEIIPVPVTQRSFQLKFSRNKIFTIVTDPGPDMRIEVYSKSL